MKRHGAWWLVLSLVTAAAGVGGAVAGLFNEQLWVATFGSVVALTGGATAVVSRRRERAEERAECRRLHAAVGAWLDAVTQRTGEVPGYFPEGIDIAAVRQDVTIVDRPRQDLEAEQRSTFEGEEGPGYQPPAVWEPDNDAVGGRRRCLEGVLAECDRVVVLGDPGMGKTWLLQRLAHQRAAALSEALAAVEPAKATPEGLLAGHPIMLAATVGAVATRRLHGAGVWEALIDAVVEPAGLDAPDRERVADWLQHHRQASEQPVVVLLDGLDEYSPDPQREDPLPQTLADIAAREHTTVVIASRTVNYRPVLAEAKTVQIAAFDPGQVQAFVRAWYDALPEGSSAADALLNQLKASPQLHTMARIPLLLSFLCLAASPGATDAHQPAALPTRRVELYDRVVTRLLQRPWTDRPLDPQVEQHAALIDQRRDQLQTLAAAMTEPGWQERVTASAARTILYEAGSTDPGGDLAAMGDLLTRAGLGEADERVWVHRTLHEFLLAEHLAAQGGAHAVATLRPHFWYDRDWYETITLTAGLLNDPRALLDAIHDEPDDAFHAMVLLAGAALAETPDPPAHDCHDTIPGIRHLLTTSSETLFHRALGVAERLGQLVFSSYSALHQALPSDGRRVRTATAGAMAGSDTAFEALTGLARNSSVLSGVISGLGTLGGPQAVAVLAEIAENPATDPLVRPEAARQLAALGQRDIAVAVLTEQAQDPDVHSVMRPEAAIGLGALGERDTAVAVLAELARHPDTDEFTRIEATVGLWVVGGPSAVAVLDELARNADMEPGMRYAAARQLGALGEHDTAVAVLAQLARTPDTDVQGRREAVRELRALGGPQAAMVLAELAESSDTEPVVRQVAAAGLGALGERDTAVAVLAELARNSEGDPGVRQAAAAGLGALGERDTAVAVLAELARNPDTDPEVRREAARELGALGERDTAVAVLAEQAQRPDADPQGRQWAAEGLGALGERDTAVAVLVQLAQVGGRPTLPMLGRDLEQLGTTSPDLVLQAVLDTPPAALTTTLFDIAASTAPELAVQNPQEWPSWRQSLQSLMRWHDQQLSDPNAGPFAPPAP